MNRGRKYQSHPEESTAERKQKTEHGQARAGQRDGVGEKGKEDRVQTREREHNQNSALRRVSSWGMEAQEQREFRVGRR